MNLKFQAFITNCSWSSLFYAMWWNFQIEIRKSSDLWTCRDWRL